MNFNLISREFPDNDKNKLETIGTAEHTQKINQNILQYYYTEKYVYYQYTTQNVILHE